MSRNNGDWWHIHFGFVYVCARFSIRTNWTLKQLSRGLTMLNPYNISLVGGGFRKWHPVCDKFVASSFILNFELISGESPFILHSSHWCEGVRYHIAISSILKVWIMIFSVVMSECGKLVYVYFSMQWLKTFGNALDWRCLKRQTYQKNINRWWECILSKSFREMDMEYDGEAPQLTREMDFRLKE